jgi:adenosylhomocysteine nucleosidase
MPRIAIIAAMEREVRPLIRHWKAGMMVHSGRQYRLFQHDDAFLVCGGIGAAAARRATEALIQEVKPEYVLSVGFAGALDDSLQVGHVLEPHAVINAADGVRTEVGRGGGILLSSAVIADPEQKVRFREAYGAHAVDMEAAAVAQGAEARGVEFGALKAISDAADSQMPPMDRFVREDGSFDSARFARHVALRPWMWGSTIALARNSSKASHALCGALASYLSGPGADLLTSRSAPFAGGLNRTKVTPESASGHTSGSLEAHTKGKQRC